MGFLSGTIACLLLFAVCFGLPLAFKCLVIRGLGIGCNETYRHVIIAGLFIYAIFYTFLFFGQILPIPYEYDIYVLWLVFFALCALEGYYYKKKLPDKKFPQFKTAFVTNSVQFIILGLLLCNA